MTATRYGIGRTDLVRGGLGYPSVSSRKTARVKPRPGLLWQAVPCAKRAGLGVRGQGMGMGNTETVPFLTSGFRRAPVDDANLTARVETVKIVKFVKILKTVKLGMDESNRMIESRRGPTSGHSLIFDN
jgi:hypothetical protein